MNNDLIKEFNNLSNPLKKKVLLNDSLEIIKTLEKICRRKGINIEKISKTLNLDDLDNIDEKNFYAYMYIILLYIKEDLPELIEID